MPQFPPVADQLALLTRGITELHTLSELEARLTESRDSGRPLRVKAGFDPTRPDLHLGHAVLMAKMRQFQQLGHTAILLVGEFTALVGDPTGQNDLRPRLTRTAVQEAAKTYTEQAFKILDPARTEVRSNAEWLDKLTATELVELMAKMTVSRMLERNDFKKRYDEQRPIFQHEFLYPLLQGYDSVALDNDIELGGTDQLFNLMVGRDLMPRYGKRPQIVLTTPILEGTDAKMLPSGEVTGKKMSKSADNYIGLAEAPLSMFRKVMQVDDDVIFRYFDLLSARDNAEIAQLRSERKAGKNPLEFKAAFAREIIEQLHSAGAATEAEAEFKRVYSADATPEHMDAHTFPAEGEALWLPKALALAGLVKSTSEGRRLVEQGGVEVDSVRVQDPQAKLAVRADAYVVRVGSKNRKFAKLTVVAS